MRTKHLAQAKSVFVRRDEHAPSKQEMNVPLAAKWFRACLQADITLESSDREVPDAPELM